VYRRRSRGRGGDVTHIVILQHLHCRITDEKRNVNNGRGVEEKEKGKKRKKKKKNEKSQGNTYEWPISSKASVASVPA
jgi:hypothetical protein